MQIYANISGAGENGQKFNLAPKGWLIQLGILFRFRPVGPSWCIYDTEVMIG
jgi:hypothetical protein